MTDLIDRQGLIIDQTVEPYIIDVEYSSKKIKENIPVIVEGKPLKNSRGEIIFEEVERVKIYIKNNLRNCIDFLTNHRKYEGRIRYNSWFNLIEFKEKLYGEKEEKWRYIQDEDETEIAYWIGKYYGVHFKDTLMHRAIKAVAKRNRYNPFALMISALPKISDQDIQEMIDKRGATDLEFMLEDHFGVVDVNGDGFPKIVSKRWMIGTLLRPLRATVEKPIKHEIILALYGEQSIGKSSAIRALCMEDAYFGDVVFDIKNKDTPQRIQGKWIYELKELASRRKAEAEKAFYDNQIDECRLPWGKNFVKFPRRCSFVATTNRIDILNDSSGSRRWLPVHCGMRWNKDRTHIIEWDLGERIDCKALSLAAPRLWAEALYWIDKNVDHWLDPTEEKLRITNNANYQSVHPLSNRVKSIASKLQMSSLDICSVPSILDELNWEMSRRDHKIRATIEMILMSLGYRKVRRKVTFIEEGKECSKHKRFWYKNIRTTKQNKGD